MAIPHASSGEVVDVRPWVAALANSIVRTLAETAGLGASRGELSFGAASLPH